MQEQLRSLQEVQAQAAGLTCLRPGALESIITEVAMCRHITITPEDLYFEAADFWADHPGLSHIPQARVSSYERIVNEERLSALAALCIKCKLHQRGNSISTSSGQSTARMSISAAEKVMLLLHIFNFNIFVLSSITYFIFSGPFAGTGRV